MGIKMPLILGHMLGNELNRSPVFLVAGTVDVPMIFFIFML
jgi:hypothetical protein